MTEEQAYLIAARIYWLELEKEQAYRDYIDKVAGINREIAQLQSEIFNDGVMT